MKRTFPKSIGFTIIELMVSVGVLMLLTGGLLASYNNYTQGQQLKQAALTLKANLRLAQSRALSGLKPSSGCSELVGYAVSFTFSTYSVQAQCTNGVTQTLVGATTDVSLPSTISLVAPPSSVVFGILTRGLMSANSAVTLKLTGFGKNYQLVISPNGDITDSGFQP